MAGMGQQPTVLQPSPDQVGLRHLQTQASHTSGCRRAAVLSRCNVDAWGWPTSKKLLAWMASSMPTMAGRSSYSTATFCAAARACHPTGQHAAGGWVIGVTRPTLMLHLAQKWLRCG